MPIPTFIELEGHQDMKMARLHCFFFLHLEVPPDKEDLHRQIQVNLKKVVYVLLDYLQSNPILLMYISSQQPSMPTHEEVYVLTVKRVTHSEQLAEEVRKNHIGIGRQQNFSRVH